MRPGLRRVVGLPVAQLLIFVSSVRELGASILLMGPNSKVITPAIAEAWFSTSSELTAAMALIQTVVIGLATLLFAELTRRGSRRHGDKA
jgi:iron(III) transport system permease protein